MDRSTDPSGAYVGFFSPSVAEHFVEGSYTTLISLHVHVCLGAGFRSRTDCHNDSNPLASRTGPESVEPKILKLNYV